MPQIEVTFDIDANGILNVKAKDQATRQGAENHHYVVHRSEQGGGRQDARTDAESHADEDKRKLAEIEARNMLDSRVYQVEKLVNENREKLPESDLKPVEDALAAAKSALAGQRYLSNSGGHAES